MPKVNVYLSDELAAAVRDADISISPICQQALAEAVRRVQIARGVVAALRSGNFDPTDHPRISAGLMQRMTPRLTHVLAHAKAMSADGEQVGTEHLLLALIDEPGNVGVELLEVIGVDVVALRAEAVAATRTSATDEGDDPDPDQLLDDLGLEARLALAGALEAAIEHEHNYLGCEHLLLGLAATPDRGAGRLLNGAGADVDHLARAMPAAIAGVAAGFHNARQATTDLTAVLERLETIEQRLSSAGL